jgi:hypothetical protein
MISSKGRSMKKHKSYTIAACSMMLLAAVTGVIIAQSARLSNEQLAAQFANPSVEFRGAPFWAWDGDLKEQELDRQVQIFKEMGFGGFFMHSRNGLQTEYLGDEWFRLTNTTADTAKRIGIQPWLYDEDNWPSGTAGGYVVRAHPDYVAKTLVMRGVPAAEFQWDNGLLAAFACDVKDYAFTQCNRLTAQSPESARAGKTILTFKVEGQGTDVDRLRRDVTESWMELTHEAYKKRAGSRIGTTIPGIFTDEPTVPLIVQAGRGGRGGGAGAPAAQGATAAPVPALQGSTAWTEAFAATFQKRWGYDLVDRLPELFLYKNGETVSPVKWNYMEVVTQMFLENWAKPIYDWCEKNKMIFTGHVVEETSFTGQLAHWGSHLRFYEYEQLPGIDTLSGHTRMYWIAKQVASAGHQLGRKRLLDEQLGTFGWGISFETMKQQGDWEVLYGINLRTPHLSWYTMEGSAKRDFPASINYQSSWYKDYKSVEDYFARMATLLYQGEPARDVMIVYPIESVAAQIGLGWANGQTGAAPYVRDLESAYEQVFHWLNGAHIDFEYGDEEMMSRMASVGKDAMGPIFRFGQAAYRSVVVPKLVTIRSSTLKLLNDFQSAGGKVVFVGEPPAYVDAVKSTAAAELAAKSTRVNWDGDALAGAVRDSVRYPVEVLDDAGKNMSDVFIGLRADGDRKVLGTISQNGEKELNGLRIRIKSAGSVSEWDSRTGERFSIPSKPANGWTEWQADFPQYGSHMYVLTAAPIRGLSPKPVYTEVSRVQVTGPFEYELKDRNMYLLERPRYKIGDGEWQPETAITGIGQAVIAASGAQTTGGRGGQPWREKKWGAPAVPLARLTMAFNIDVETVPQGAVQLAMERPENFTVTLNGQALPASSVNGWWVDTSFQTLPIPNGLLKQGANELLVSTNYRKDINTEAMYLVGNFGVRVDGTKRTITTLPAKLNLGTITDQGLPFYRGELVYRIPVQAKASAGQRVFIETPKFAAACVRVTSAKGATQVLGWKPYRADITGETGTVAVSTMLTGQNAFGSSGGGRGGFGGAPPAGAAPGAAGGAARGAAAGGGQTPPAGMPGAPGGQGRGGAAQPPGVPNFAPAGLLEAPVITVMQAAGTK